MPGVRSARAGLPLWAILGALGLSLAMRLFALALAGDVPHFGDPDNYLRLAEGLIRGEGLAQLYPDPSTWTPTASFPPVLPLLLAAVGSVVPLSALTLCVLNSLIDGAAALLLGRLADQLGRGDLAAPVGLAYLAWPSLALMAPLAYKEGLVIALLLASLVALLEHARSGRMRWIVASGIAAGVMVLAQPAIAPILPLAFVALAPRFANRARWLRASLIAAGVALLVMLPWWIRNALAFGRFIPFTSSGGLALWQGTHPAGGLQYQVPPPEWAQAGEFAGGEQARRAAWDIIAADPLGYLQRCLVKFPKSFLMSNWAIDQLVLAKGQPWPELARSAWLRIAPMLAELAVAMVALVGLVRLPRSLAARLLWAGVAQVMLVGMWFEFSERHRMFMVPFILLMAAMVLVKEHRGRSTLQAA